MYNDRLNGVRLYIYIYKKKKKKKKNGKMIQKYFSLRKINKKWALRNTNQKLKENLWNEDIREKKKKKNWILYFKMAVMAEDMITELKYFYGIPTFPR